MLNAHRKEASAVLRMSCTVEGPALINAIADALEASRLILLQLPAEQVLSCPPVSSGLC